MTVQSLHSAHDLAARQERKHILVVEDSPVPAQMVATLLRNAGFEVSVARDARSAWRKAQQHQFDLVLTDEQMPCVNGSELCRRLRADERYREIPLVLFTSKKWTTNMVRLAKELDIAATVYKAFRTADLVATVESALARGTTLEQG